MACRMYELSAFVDVVATLTAALGMQHEATEFESAVCNVLA